MAQPVTRPEFKVGDRVRYVETATALWGKLMIGDTGTVRVIQSGNYGVEFDRYVEGHDIGGACKKGYGFWILPAELATLEEEQEDTIQLPDMELIF